MLGSRLVVSRHRPGRVLLQSFLAAVLAAGGMYLTYIYGRASSSLEFAVVRADRDELMQQYSESIKENTELRERVAILERAGQIDRKAYDDVDHHLLKLQSEIFLLKEEVAFYRGIVSSTGAKGLSIQSFQVESGAVESGYRYLLVLTQDMKSDKVVSGTVQMSIAGEQDGITRRIPAEGVRDTDNRQIEFQFKHFQKIEGTFSLPEGFSPHSVLVQITDNGETVAEKTFEWPLPVT